MNKKKGKDVEAPTNTKTLSDQILDLFDPTPRLQEYQPKGFEVSKAKMVNFDDYRSEMDSIEDNKGKRDNFLSLKSDIENDYGGVKTSRAELKEQIGFEDRFSLDDDASDDSIPNSPQFEFEEVEDVNTDKNKQGADEEDDEEGENGTVGDDEEEDDDEGEEGDEEEDEGEGEDEDVADGNGLNSDELADKLEDEINQMDEDDKSDTIQELFLSKQHEIDKAQHVRNQRILFGSMFDVFSGLHRIEAVANKLPTSEKYSAVKNESIQSRSNRVQNEMQKLLTELCDVRDTMLSGSSLPIDKTKKRKREEEDDTEGGEEIDKTWSKIQSESRELYPVLNQVISKWDRRTQLQSGKAKGFKALEKSVVDQINLVNQNKDRLIKRSRVNRRLKGNKKEDEEIFDDTDFYDAMLKEVSENDLEISDEFALGKRYLALKKEKQKNKLKKKVDQKASKGRKLKYDVNPLLVSFVPPQPRVYPAITEELLLNLFQVDS